MQKSSLMPSTKLSAKIQNHRFRQFQPSLKITPNKVGYESTQGIADGGHVLSRQSVGMSCQTPMGKDVTDTGCVSEDG
jgi:hypothetical protein